MNQTSAPARSLTFRLFGMMLLEFFIWGAWLPLIWGYMEGLGFSGTQIALIGSAFAIASLLAIFAGNQFVDRTFAAEGFRACSHLVGGLAMTGLFFTRDFTVFFVLMLIHSICYVPTISVANSLVFSHLKDAQAEFGRVRMGGTMGWILAWWPLYFVLKGVSGAELQHALGYIFWVAGGASLLLAAFSLTLPHTPPKPAGGGTEALAWREALGVLLKKPFLLVLFIVTFIDSTVHNGYFLLTGGFFRATRTKPPKIIARMSICPAVEIGPGGGPR